MDCDAQAAMVARENTLDRGDRQIGGAVVDDDHRDVDGPSIRGFRWGVDHRCFHCVMRRSVA